MATNNLAKILNYIPNTQYPTAVLNFHSGHDVVEKIRQHFILCMAEKGEYTEVEDTLIMFAHACKSAADDDDDCSDVTDVSGQWQRRKVSTVIASFDDSALFLSEFSGPGMEVARRFLTDTANRAFLGSFEFYIAVISNLARRKKYREALNFVSSLYGINHRTRSLDLKTKDLEVECNRIVRIMTVLGSILRKIKNTILDNSSKLNHFTIDLWNDEYISVTFGGNSGTYYSQQGRIRLDLSETSRYAEGLELINAGDKRMTPLFDYIESI